jgi:hypothetical protein
MELLVPKKITWHFKSFIRFAGPVGDCAIMLAVQRINRKHPNKTNQQKETQVK